MIDAMEVTEVNIDFVAEWCGGEVLVSSETRTPHCIRLLSAYPEPGSLWIASPGDIILRLSPTEYRVVAPIDSSRWL